ncbi:MAG: hypothetical protein ACR2N8_02965 [Parvibaculales bacterium]
MASVAKMKAIDLIPIEHYETVFDYIPETGELLDKEIGKQRGYKNADGMWITFVPYKGHKWAMPAARIVVAMFEKQKCKKVIFIDGDKSNHRIENLEPRY